MLPAHGCRSERWSDRGSNEEGGPRGFCLRILVLMMERSSSAEVTLFAIPKAFEGPSVLRQRNALSSWVRLPHTQILLMGDDAGVEEAAAEFDVGHVAPIRRNEFGTPLLNDAFAKARLAAKGSLLCYVNSDIILFEDVLDAAQVIEFRSFLASTRRVDLEVMSMIDVDERSHSELRDRAARAGSLGSQWAIDVFILPTALPLQLPPFAVGRPGWDNWLISHAREKGWAVVDLTPDAVVFHQKHDYQHVPGGTGLTFEGPEAAQNRALAGDIEDLCSLDCATHVVKGGKIRRAVRYANLRATTIRFARRHPPLDRMVRLLSPVVRGIRRSFTK